jgi:hypothetical protein
VIPELIKLVVRMRRPVRKRGARDGVIEKVNASPALRAVSRMKGKRSRYGEV